MSAETTATTQIGMILDHEARAVADLPIRRRGPRWTAAAQAIGRAVQRFEDAAFALLLDCGVSGATGGQLDRVGALVGATRGAADDEEYRAFISARILANRSTGTPDELIRILQLVTAPSTVEGFTLPPASCVLQVTRATTLPGPTRRRIRRLMESARPLGVGMGLVLVVDPSFGHDEDPSALGFDDGPFAEVL